MNLANPNNVNYANAWYTLKYSHQVTIIHSKIKLINNVGHADTWHTLNYNHRRTNNKSLNTQKKLTNCPHYVNTYYMLRVKSSLHQEQSLNI